MTLTTAQVALIGVGAGVVAATIPALIALATQRGQRAHERDIATAAQAHQAAMARAERRYADLRLVYVDLMRFVIEEVERMRRVLPVIGPLPEPSAGITESDALALQARIYAYASEPVKEAIEEFLLIRNKFAGQVAYVHHLQDERSRGVHLSDEESPIRGRMEVEHLRVDAVNVMERLRILTRDELIA